jgi:hypothetical protein
MVARRRMSSGRGGSGSRRTGGQWRGPANMWARVLFWTGLAAVVGDSLPGQARLGGWLGGLRGRQPMCGEGPTCLWKTYTYRRWVRVLACVCAKKEMVWCSVE